MKCLNKYLALVLAVIMVTVTGCGSEQFDNPYGTFDTNDSYNFDSSGTAVNIDLFAKNLCANDSNILDSSAIDSSTIYGAAVYDVNACKVIYSYNAFERINPASLTKILVALVVMEKCPDLNQVITLGDVSIKESGAQVSGLKEGDRISVSDLLRASLIYSGNDAAMALALYVAGSEADFAAMMNAKAAELGCTGTNYVNCTGLTHENHYTTVYDLYLMFNEAIKYPLFLEIISTPSTEITYTNYNGESITKTLISTDKFLTGDYASPDSLNILGGKTGSTNAARKCIMVLATDDYGNPYIAVVMGAEDEQKLYKTMIQLCNEVI